MLKFTNLDQENPDKKELGNRVESIKSGAKIYLPGGDLSIIEDASEIRLKNLCNVKINGNTLEFSGFEHKKGIPIFQWCSESKVKIDQQIKNWNKIDHNLKSNNSPTPYKFK